MTRIKICGISRLEDGLVALEGGADYLGFVFYRPSHRYVTPERAADLVDGCRSRFSNGWRSVGVFVNEPIDLVNEIAETAGLDMVQLCGEEDASFCADTIRPAIKVVRVDSEGRPSGSTWPTDWNADLVLLDTDRPGHYGGTGQAINWTQVRPHAAQALLAGGLSAQNVAQAMRLAKPWGLDVSSGVERSKVKDPELIKQFLAEVKRYDGC